MPLHLLIDVFAACGAPKWIDNNSSVDLVVEKMSIPFNTLRQLERDGVFAEKLSSSLNHKIQIDFNSGKEGELPPSATFRIKLPRVIGGCVVAKNLADLLSISSATYREPKAYLLVNAEGSDAPFIFSGPESLSNATSLIRRYHDAIALWQVIANQSEHSVVATHHLLFFGIRKTEIIPYFSINDLEDEIPVSEIAEFSNNKDREETRKEIFRSVLSEFLQDQKPHRTFSYLLRQSTLFSRRLKEGLAIYLSDHSPEKLAQEADAKYLELIEKLEKIVSGMEAKSLTIPAAVLLAVKEAELGGKWTTLNTIIIVSTGLYLIAMLIVFLSQRAILNLLATTIQKTTANLKQQGLDEKNPILSESFVKLDLRRKHAQIGSRIMFGFSFVPLLAVIYAIFYASQPQPTSYTFKLTPTTGVQIIQSSNSQPTVPMSNTNSQPPVKLPSETKPQTIQ
jgi:hypothetical protein